MPESRFTFHKIVNDVAWQRQLRDRHVHEGTPAGVDLSLNKAVIRPISRETAAQIILKYEWLGTMQSSSLHFGLFFGPYVAGVTCVALRSSGVACPGIGVQYGVSQDDVCILVRGACVHWAPPGANSKLVSWTCKLLAKQKAGKIILAFADEDAGEIGTIYQACNWAYIGRSAYNVAFVSPAKRAYNRRMIGERAKQDGVSFRAVTTALANNGWTKQAEQTKHKYAFVLDKSDAVLVKRVEALRLPYPKRVQCAGSVVGNTPDVQSGDGGSTPTPALHE